MGYDMSLLPVLSLGLLGSYHLLLPLKVSLRALEAQRVHFWF